MNKPAYQKMTLQPEAVFSRVLVGIDGSPASIAAAQQAALLQATAGTITFLTAWNLTPPLVPPMTMLPPHDDVERAAKQAAEATLRIAKEHHPTAATVLAYGFAADALIAEAERSEATLIAVGSHGRGRAAGVISGSTATRLMHEAAASVLVTHETDVRVPRHIAVGVDGSPESAVAYATAVYLADRFDGELRVVLAEGGKTLDRAGVWLIVGEGIRTTARDPVSALTAASLSADLVVVGSRGLHGVRALGSVSERVGHRAKCSTLIVRRS